MMIWGEIIRVGYRRKPFLIWAVFIVIRSQNEPIKSQKNVTQLTRTLMRNTGLPRSYKIFFQITNLRIEKV